MVSVEIVKVKGNDRSIGGYTVGTLHIAKMSKEYVSDIREIYQVNDLIQATVIKSKPAILFLLASATHVKAVTILLGVKFLMF